MRLPDALHAWCRTNPLWGRVLLRALVALPLGALGGGIVLLAGFPRNAAAVVAAVLAFVGSKLGERLADRMGLSGGEDLR